MERASKGRAVAAADLVEQFDERARIAIVAATEHPLIRKRYEHAGILSRLHHSRREDGPHGVTPFLRDLADMAAAGVPESGVRAVAGVVDDFLAELYPVQLEALPTLDLLEQSMESAENEMATRRLVDGLSPAELEREAALDRNHAAVKVSRARALTVESHRQRFAQAQEANR